MNLFESMAKLWNKQPLAEEEIKTDWVLRRFLASEKELAEPVAEIALKFRQPWMTWRFFQALFPKRSKAPFLQYPFPKKTRTVKNDESLLLRMMEVHNENRSQAETRMEIIELQGRTEEYLNWLGLESYGSD